MLIVVDTNVLISRYCTPHGTAARVYRLWDSQAVDLAVSTAILGEYARVLRYSHLRSLHRMTDAEIDQIIEDHDELAIVVEPSERIAVIPDDPDDDKFIECAVEAGAVYIVSGNKHLLKLGEYRGIQILPPALFVRLFDDAKTAP